ncbi:2-acylglycerol O-acyltransferase 1 [Phlyctochytrium planicorne]|nr:2-acylglycerol O-acyltransferase 1 [Phlyctochytrium planicorne]
MVESSKNDIQQEPFKLPPNASIHPSPKRNVPETTLQILTVAFWVLILPTFAVGLPILYIYLLFVYPVSTILFFATYAAYVSLDSDAERGKWTCSGVGRAFVRWSGWELFRDYFEARVVKTAELERGKNYIFCVHPHGVYCLSLWANLTSNGTALDKLFPTINLRPATLPINFKIPFWREFILSMGAISVDRKALISVLKPLENTKKGSNAVLLAVGGGEEYLHMEKQTIDLVILKRKGFAKLALQTGASLVPILSFGETDLFERIDTPFTRRMTKITQKLAHFAFPMFKGRFGPFVPYRKPLVTIVGKPLDVVRVEDPSNEQVEELHQRYLLELRKLYDEYKDLFFKDRKRDMAYVK